MTLTATFSNNCQPFDQNKWATETILLCETDLKSERFDLKYVPSYSQINQFLQKSFSNLEIHITFVPHSSFAVPICVQSIPNPL